MVGRVADVEIRQGAVDVGADFLAGFRCTEDADDGNLRERVAALGGGGERGGGARAENAGREG